MVIKRHCDKEMARGKGYAGLCDSSQCKRCPCCIETDSEGQQSHVQARRDESLYVPYELRWKESLIEEYGREGFRIDYSIH